MPTPTASARCCRATCAAAPATSPSSTPCSTPAPPTRSRRHDGLCTSRATGALPARGGGDRLGLSATRMRFPCSFRGRLGEGRGVKNTFIGSPVERREDLRFVRGRGQYVDDLEPDGLLYAVILRSAVAHGRIRSIDASAALKIAGVHAVITAQDMPGGPPVIGMRLQPMPEFKPFE